MRSSPGGETESIPERDSWGVGLVLAAIVAVGALLRFTGLADQTLWADEGFTISVLGRAGESLWDVPAAVDLTEAAPPLYYLLAWPWVRAFGDGDVGLRSLSALLGTVTIPVIFLAVRELASSRAALIAAGLCACSPILVWYSQEGRVYALSVLLAAVSFWLFARALSIPSAARLLAWGVVSAVAVASFYLAAVLVIVEAAVLLWMARERWRLVVAAAAIPTLTAAALMPYALDHRGLQTWIGGLPLDERIGQTGEHFAVGNSAPADVVVIGISLVIAVAAVGLVLRGAARERRAGGLAALVAAGCAALVIAGAIVDNDFILSRNVLFFWPPLAAAVAIALGSRALQPLGSVAAVCICALSVGLIVEVKRDDALQRADYASVAAVIGQPDPGVVRALAVTGWFHSRVLPLYLDGAAGPLIAPPPSTELILVGFDQVERQGGCWWGGACAIGDVELPHSVPGYRVIRRAVVGRFAVLHLRSEQLLQPENPIGPDTAWYGQGTYPSQ